MDALIELDDVLREFWLGFFQDFPLRDLIIMLGGTAILAFILMTI